MDGASAVAGLISLAALTLQTCVQLQQLCKSYAGAEGEAEAAVSALQALRDLLEEAQRLTSKPVVIKATTALTRARMDNILRNCAHDLQIWTERVDHALPKEASGARRRWKKAMIAVDKPQLSKLTAKMSQYTSQIDATLSILRGDLGVSTNIILTASIWSQGIFQFSAKKQLKAIASDLHEIQGTQKIFQSGAYSKLDNIGSTVTSIEVTISEFLERSQSTARPQILTEAKEGRNLLPYARNGVFVGRKSLLEEVERRLANPLANNRVAIYGLGGIGKSQLAIELAYRARENDPQLSCYWVFAASRSTFAQSYRDIAAQLNITGADDPNEDILELVRNWLVRQHSKKWLMIIDNMDDMKSLRGGEHLGSAGSTINLLRYIPQCTQGQLLFTTRSKGAALRLTNGGSIVQVEGMDASEAQELLQVKLGDDGDAFDTVQASLELVKTLEYLPLAVSHAASYIREMDITPARYLKMFNEGEEKRNRLLKHTYEDLARDSGQTNTVLTTWRISFEQIERDSPASANLLKLMGSLYYQEIPQYVLQQGDLADEDDFDIVVAPLLGFSLIQKSRERKSFSMHRLIYIATKAWTQTPEWDRAVNLLSNVFPHLESNRVTMEYRSRCSQLLPHAQKVISELYREKTPTHATCQLAYDMSGYLGALGHYKQARELAESFEEPARNSSEIKLANLLDNQVTRMLLLDGREELALERAERALASRKQVPSANQEDIIDAQDVLAWALITQRRHAEAEIILLDAYKACEEILGKTNFKTLRILRSLGAVYTGLSQHQKAIDAYQESLDYLLPIWGNRNDTVIHCMELQAEAKRCLFNVKEAGSIIRTAAALAEEVMGPNHPSTLCTLTRLGCQYYDEGEEHEAFQIHEKVWEERRVIFGDTSKPALGSLAMMALTCGNVEKSEELYWRVVKLSEELWGPHSAVTTGYQELLMGALNSQMTLEKYQVAEKYERELLKVRTEKLGSDNDLTLRVASLLGGTLVQSNSLGEGVSLLEKTLQQQIKNTGLNNDHACYTEIRLIDGLRTVRQNDAISLFRQRLKRMLVYRPNNPVCFLEKASFGNLLANNENFEEGTKICQEALEEVTKTCGPVNGWTEIVGITLVLTYIKKKDYTPAEGPLRDVLESQRERLGPEDPRTLLTQSWFTLLLLLQQRFKECEELGQATIAAVRRVLKYESLHLVVCGVCLGLSYAVRGKISAGINSISETNSIACRVFSPGHLMFNTLRLITNIIRDALLSSETQDWDFTLASSLTPKEFETVYPIELDRPLKVLRRVQSCYLFSGEGRLYQEESKEDRSISIKILRGELNPQDIPTYKTWRNQCFQCQKDIAINAEFYRCKLCANGKYTLCDHCHSKGCNCLHFEHILNKQRAYRLCNCCEKEIDQMFTYRCYTCDHHNFDACETCYGEGRRCDVPDHILERRKQECFEEPQVDHDESRLECDRCEVKCPPETCSYHCAKCSDNDYDICSSCFDRRNWCRDQSHVLIKRDPAFQCSKCDRRISETFVYHCATCQEGNFHLCGTCFHIGIRCENQAAHTLSRQRQQRFYAAVADVDAAHLCAARGDVFVDGQPPADRAADGHHSCRHCETEIHAAEDYYHCSFCDNGDYSICLACYALDRRCLAPAHVTTFVKAGAQVDAAT